MKKCSKCKEIKNFEEFGKNKSRKDGFHHQCKSCQKKYYEENKEQVKKRQKKHREENKELIKERAKKWREDNKEYKKKYRKENRDAINKYFRERRDSEPLFKLTTNLRNRTSYIFKYKNIKKNSRTHEMLGIEWEELKVYIEDMFTDGMTWENYGEWHIDHIYPLSKAKDKKHLKELCHYTNLQPLWAKDNISKGNKIL